MFTPLHRPRIHVVRFPPRLGRDELTGLIDAVKSGSAAADYDVLVDYSAVKAVDLTPDELVPLAMARRAGLPDLGDHPVRSAAVAVGPEAADFLETWTLFFVEHAPAIVTRTFATIEDALAWFGKPDAVEAVRAALRA